MEKTWKSYIENMENAENLDLENVKRGKNVKIWTEEFSNAEIWTWKFFDSGLYHCLKQYSL